MIEKKQVPILIFTVAYVLGFSIHFMLKQNYEFIFYVFVLVFFLLLVLFSAKRMKYSQLTLWGLSIWGLLHMGGGGIFIGEQKLYGLMLMNISDTYNILRYDQVVHAFGFGVATMVMYEVIKPALKDKVKNWFPILLVVAMAGAGLGSINEIVEFMATIFIPDTGVGGYINNSVDLVANLIGTIIAALIIYFSERKKAKA